jgi:hypothetical protein
MISHRLRRVIALLLPGALALQLSAAPVWAQTRAMQPQPMMPRPPAMQTVPSAQQAAILAVLRQRQAALMAALRQLEVSMAFLERFPPSMQRNALLANLQRQQATLLMALQQTNAQIAALMRM